MVFLFSMQDHKIYYSAKMAKVFFSFNFDLEEQNPIILIKIHGISTELLNNCL